MKVHEQAIVPYTDPDQQMALEEAWTAGVGPIREFMSQQIARAGNGGDVRLFLDYLPPISPPPQSYADVPLQALLPAFLVSELKLAFVIGFQIYLPFVIIDLVVSSVTMSMGMVMVPPMAISLPLKLLLFVLADGWRLIVQMLLSSFQFAA
jgi:flagellar biosynthetic protein FliP